MKMYINSKGWSSGSQGLMGSWFKTPSQHLRATHKGLLPIITQFVWDGGLHTPKGIGKWLKSFEYPCLQKNNNNKGLVYGCL